MNKKQIETIVKGLVTFTIETPNYRSGVLNSSKIEFPVEGLMLIHDDKETYIETKAVKIIRGVRL